jgi:uncharacterized protein (TIGR03435 family)
MSVLVGLLARSTGRIVVDETGLTGLFDWDLRYDPLEQIRVGVRATGLAIPADWLALLEKESQSPPVEAALREQLGLKVVTEGRPLEVLVIDHADLPTPD